MNTHTIHKIALSLILGGTLSVASNPVMAATTTPGITISQIPLSTGVTGVVPNIMLMVDNSGSMSTSFNVLGTAISPNDMPTSTTYTCNTKISGGAATAGAATTPVYMVVRGTSVPSTPASCTVASGVCTTTNFSTSKCFDNTLYYNIKNFDTNASFGVYKGINLNWYFKTGKFAPGNLVASSTTSSTTRTQMAKTAATALVDSLTPALNEKATVRMGFTSYYSGLLVPMDDIKNVNGVTTQANLIKTQIAAISTDNNTPLSTTLNDIGRYFAGTGVPESAEDNIQLTLHPGVTNQVATIKQIFNDRSFTGDSTVNYVNKGTSTAPNYATTPPIQSFCQKSAVILVSDGLPNGSGSTYDERGISTYLRDYTGDCAVKHLCDSTISSISLPGTGLPLVPLNGTGTTCKSTSAVKDRNGNIITPAIPNDWYNIACQNGTKAGRVYETGGSDFLDDIAQALYDIDLRPVWPGITKPSGSKNNLKTYAIGIADPTVSSNSVLKDAANLGGGKFAYADNLPALIDALDKMVQDIQKGVGSFSAIAANSSQLTASSALFQAKYDTTDWTGDFIALPLTPSEDKNGNGILDPGEDTNNNGVLDTGGVVLAPAWDAGEKIPSYLTRNIFTYNPTATPKGVSFKGASAVQICNKLTGPGIGTQQAALGITTACSSTDQGVWLIDYLRGDISHEIIDTLHPLAYNSATNPNPDPRAVNTDQVFRNRARFWGADAIAPIKEGDLRKPDPWLLGDIVNSDPVYVSNESYGYNILAGTKSGEGTTYSAFLATKNSRLKMSYVGANDGMLHGFNSTTNPTDASYATAGTEVLAYIPNTIFDRLPNLALPDYGHLYYVDGSPRVSDVYYGSAWHTVLVGSTGAGGHGVFALDVTDPANFSTANVLWEISNTDAPTVGDLNTDTTALRGFKNNMGYTLPQASIGKMHDGSWAAIVANGYASGNNLGVLYILNIQTGAIIKAFDTTISSAGLSTPFAADVDGDGIIDAIYAGDLLGNMWKFDVSASSPSNWKIAYGTATAPAPLFTACLDASSVANCDLTRQAITNKPQVGKVGVKQTTGTVMVYFGTGKYFEDSDNNIANTKTQSFYGVWDECPLVTAVTTGTHSCPVSTGTITNVGVQKSSLVQQSIIAELAASVTVPFNIRVTSNSSVTYPTQKGWYMDFVNVNSTTTPQANDGERIVSASLLRGGRIVFTTLIPIPPTVATNPNDLCTAGSKSTSWLMELDALSGSRLTTPALNITTNGKVDSADVVTVTVGGQSITVPASGVKMTNGSTKTPAVITNPGSDELKFTGSSEGKAPTQGIAETPASTGQAGAGRQSWRQL